MLFARIVLNYLKADRLRTLFTITTHNSLQQTVPASTKRTKSFAVAMSDALEKLEQQQEEKRQEIAEAVISTKEIKKQKNNLKRRKWVDFNAVDVTEGSEAKRAPFDPADRVKRKKSAILLGYSGANYYGMQRNPGMATIEEELFKAMRKHKWITDESFEQAQHCCFQRAARTDKGVSAARQVCSLKLPEDLNVKALNEDLPKQIRLFAVERVTKGFNAKENCNARTYTYTMPSIAFSDLNEKPEYETFRIPKEKLKKARDVLQMFEGTKNFHNFTSRKNFLDPSSKRFIMSFTCSDPFVSPQGIEFVTVKIKGQSFMLHQIRKMVGLTIAIVRGHTEVQTLERALTEERLDIPMAPGLGLVLDTVHYERYNDRYGSDGIHNPLTWEKQEEEIREFIESKIYSNIYKTEAEEKPLLEWLEILSLHTYDTRRDELPNDNGTNKNTKDDDEE